MVSGQALTHTLDRHAGNLGRQSQESNRKLSVLREPVVFRFHVATCSQKVLDKIYGAVTRAGLGRTRRQPACRRPPRLKEAPAKGKLAGASG